MRAGADDVQLPPEVVRYLDPHLGGSGRGHREHRRVAQITQRIADEQIIRPEIVPPHAHAMGLIDHQAATPLANEWRAETASAAASPEPHTRAYSLPRANVPQPPLDLIAIQRAVDQRRLLLDARGQTVHLVLHKRDQRRHHQRDPVQQHRRKLITQALARPRGHRRKHALARQHVLDHPLLAGPKRSKPKSRWRWDSSSGLGSGSMAEASRPSRPPGRAWSSMVVSGYPYPDTDLSVCRCSRIDRPGFATSAIISSRSASRSFSRSSRNEFSETPSCSAWIASAVHRPKGMYCGPSCSSRGLLHISDHMRV